MKQRTKPTIEVSLSRVGLEDEPLGRALDLIFNRFKWVDPTKFSDSEENYQAIGDDPVSDCMSLVEEDRIKLDVKGKGGELYLAVSRRTSEVPIGVLKYWAKSTRAFEKKRTEQLELELLEVARALHSPLTAAFDENVEEARDVYRDGTTIATRSDGYEYGLLTPRWREILGPLISNAMIDGLQMLEGTYSQNMGDGYWLLRTYDKPEDGLTQEGRAREEEIINVLGRRFFYDFQTEEQAYFRLEEDESLW